MSEQITLQLRKYRDETKVTYPCYYRGAFVTRQFYSTGKFNESIPQILNEVISGKACSEGLGQYSDMDVEITIKIKKPNGLSKRD